ncbi:hypothetical protein [uncultured Desulfobacter sp.]|uniref:hypothetical protein n=1 Tax=uncultured Desulfobacter sp. TaxID=240139 RepID=UPI002AABAEFF|nr:hypothetical protein [uncultured Desulfobacter sp.]
MMLNLRFLSIFYLSVFFFFPLTGAMAAPQDSVHITTGRHIIKGQDISGAKEAAVRDALEKAVQNAFAAAVSQQKLGENLDFLYDQLLARTMDFVTTYRIINGMSHNQEYLVGVESKISRELVENFLSDSGIFNQDFNNPKVLLLIAEQGIEDIQPRCWWWPSQGQPALSSVTEKSLKAVFKKAHIPLIATENEYPDPASYNIVFSDMYDQTAAMTLGQALKADMVIFGMASTQESFNRMGDEKTFEANVSFTVLDMASQKEVIQTKATATAKSIDTQGAGQALALAADTAGLALKEKIEGFWTEAVKDKKTFDLYVEGDNFLNRFIALKHQLKEIKDIEDISPKELGSSHAIMEVRYKGTPTQFANAVMLKTFDEFGIDVSMDSDDAVKIKFVATSNNNPAPQEIQGQGGSQESLQE